MVQVYRCKLPTELNGWRPEPLFPGSDEAIAAGCTCPPDQPWPTALLISSDCPRHELEHERH